jgi:hypothetical protein
VSSASQTRQIPDDATLSLSALPSAGIGFGATVGVLALAVLVWLCVRRRRRRRLEQEQLAEAVVQDVRRAQMEAVQRMVEDKRMQAAAARKPFLVVHPGKPLSWLGWQCMGGVLALPGFVGRAWLAMIGRGWMVAVNLVPSRPLKSASGPPLFPTAAPCRWGC